MSKNNSAKSCLIGCAVILAVGMTSGVALGQGWLEQSTGIRTPESFRQIAPNGLQSKAFSGQQYNSDFGIVETEYRPNHQQHEQLGREAEADIEFDNHVQTRPNSAHDSGLLPSGFQDPPIELQPQQQIQSQNNNPWGVLVNQLGQELSQSQQPQNQAWQPYQSPQYQAGYPPYPQQPTQQYQPQYQQPVQYQTGYDQQGYQPQTYDYQPYYGP